LLCQFPFLVLAPKGLKRESWDRTAVQAAEKVPFGVEGVPSAAKAGFIAKHYVRPDARFGEVGRTLQKHEFFRKLFSPAVND
jgi:hypothetical protein